MVSHTPRIPLACEGLPLANLIKSIKIRVPREKINTFARGRPILRGVCEGYARGYARGPIGLVAYSNNDNKRKGLFCEG